MKYEKCNVVMLPTAKSHGNIIKLSDKLHFNKSKAFPYKKDDKVFHLYITNPNEEIKEDDWIYKNGIGISKYKKGDYLPHFNKHQKIIATTDESLQICTGREAMSSILTYSPLPRPSNTFLKKYCELGGIDKVLVAYLESWGSIGKGKEIHLDIRVASDNTITIKPIKDSWSREEVIELLRQYNAHIINTNDEALGPYQFNYWIKENL